MEICHFSFSVVLKFIFPKLFILREYQLCFNLIIKNYLFKKRVESV